MEIIENQTFDQERALYGSHDLCVRHCAFDGPADGESAFKECANVRAEDCFYNLRYPFWHDDGLVIENGEMTPNCRAALWYSRHITITGTKMHGIKALRECADVTIQNCDIVSPEFGWSTRGIRLEDSTAVSEYFMMRSEDIVFRNVRFTGKYSFQYIKNALFENCVFDTKDAFWHGENVTVRNCTVKGEYLAWYSDGLTLDHCRIIGTQPLCYCKGLILEDCTMEGCDLSFENSDVVATVNGSIDSVKNPVNGSITADAIGDIILDEHRWPGECPITIRGQEASA